MSKPTNSADVDAAIDKALIELADSMFHQKMYDDDNYLAEKLDKAKQQLKALLSDQVKAAQIELLNKLIKFEYPEKEKWDDARNWFFKREIETVLGLSPTNGKEII